jgi:hypothetical protein
MKLMLPVFVIVALAAGACTSTDQPQAPTATETIRSPVPTQSVQERADARFLTAVAAVPVRKFQVYWLGRAFTDGVLNYRGPYFAGTADNDANVLELEYTAGFGSGGGAGMNLTLYSRDGWAKAKSVLLKDLPGTRTTDVDVSGHLAQLVKIPSPELPINVLILVIDLGDTVVLADTGALYPVTPGVDNLNPLIADPNRFVDVMSHLRPYPQ